MSETVIRNLALCAIALVSLVEVGVRGSRHESRHCTHPYGVDETNAFSLRCSVRSLDLHGLVQTLSLALLRSSSASASRERERYLPRSDVVTSQTVCAESPTAIASSVHGVNICR